MKMFLHRTSETSRGVSLIATAISVLIFMISSCSKSGIEVSGSSKNGLDSVLYELDDSNYATITVNNSDRNVVIVGRSLLLKGFRLEIPRGAFDDSLTITIDGKDEVATAGLWQRGLAAAKDFFGLAGINAVKLSGSTPLKLDASVTLPDAMISSLSASALNALRVRLVDSSDSSKASVIDRSSITESAGKYSFKMSAWAAISLDDITPPKLSSNTATTVTNGNTFTLAIQATKALKSFTKDQVAMTNGTISSVHRRLI